MMNWLVLKKKIQQLLLTRSTFTLYKATSGFEVAIMAGWVGQKWVKRGTILYVDPNHFVR